MSILENAVAIAAHRVYEQKLIEYLVAGADEADAVRWAQEDAADAADDFYDKRKGR